MQNREWNMIMIFMMMIMEYYDDYEDVDREGDEDKKQGV